jgi:N-acetylglucosamine-6-phosphate deacetylase
MDIFEGFRGTSVWVPRRKTSVKIKSLGAVDIHFHGAFGIDLMSASTEELNRLARLLRAQGVAAFCPTTLSVPWSKLREAVQRLGQWTAERRRSPDPQGALPLGLHLEGPYISPGACGAHPPEGIRKLDLAELETLWEDSAHQLKILTLAPEILAPPELKQLVSWAQKRQITLSAGHSKATEAQAKAAFDQGFSSLTHAWNAVAFHQRAPGILGAALGRKDVHLELILDQVHVSPTVMRWTRKLHGAGICFVSDCVPAAGTQDGTRHSFGHLEIQLTEGACRLANGALAGGGRLLPEAFARWVEAEAAYQGDSTARILKRELPGLGQIPLRSIGCNAKRLKLAQVEWSVSASASSSGKVQFRVL